MRKVRTEGKARKPWVYTRARKISMEEARRQLSILINIGKKYRDVEARKMKPKG
jgi:hypothetical protein